MPVNKNRFHNTGHTSCQNDDGVSALLGVILMIALVVSLTGILSGFFLGFMMPVQKTVYLIADAQYSQKNGSPLITLSHQGGEALPLSGLGPASIQVVSSSGSQTAQPDPSGLVWKPGMTLYIARTSAGYTVTNDVNRIPASPLEFPGGQTIVSIVDSSNTMLIYSKTLQIPVPLSNVTTSQTVAYSLVSNSTTTTIPSSTSTPTPTATVSEVPTSSVTASPTATQSPVETTNTTASPTATSTSVPTTNTTATLTTTTTSTPTAISTRTITVIWSPSASGYGSLSPPTKLANSAEVIVPRGSSKTIYYVPNANVSVRTITLDGTKVYTGSSIGTTVSYTVTNIVEDRTLIATFG